MTSLHAIVAVAALATAAILTFSAAIAYWRDVAHEPIRVAALLSIGIFGVAALLGLATLVSGSAPGEWLHFVYGVALLGVLPLGLTFAAEAPARARSGVLAAAGIVALLLTWRLFTTG